MGTPPEIKGDDIRQFRENFGLTQEDFAMGAGLSLIRLQQIEAMPVIGRAIVEIDLRRLCNLINTSTAIARSLIATTQKS